MPDRDWLILQELVALHFDIGPFLADLLADCLSRDDQLLFALRLVVLAQHLQQRAEQTLI